VDISSGQMASLFGRVGSNNHNNYRQTNWSEKTEESRTREEWLGERLRHLKKFLLTTQ
jgi:hypothetical protein